MAEEKYVPRLKTKYQNEVRQQLQDRFQYKNVMQIPKIEKIVVNMGVGEAATDSKVTLRGARMWEFLDRLTAIAIPRIRDFRGISPDSFDGRGNFSMGVTEQLIFPEIDFDSIDRTRGMDITIVTTATTDEEGRALLDGFGFPFKK